MPKLIDPLDWDRSPADRLLTCSLAGPVFASGDETDLARTLDELAAAGLVEFRRPCPRDFADHGNKVPDGVAGMWVVFPTSASKVVGLLLATSPELVQFLDLAAHMALVGCEWAGVNMRRIIRELDLRGGGSGEVTDWGAWLRTRDREALRALPRRQGLDGDKAVPASEERLHA